MNEQGLMELLKRLGKVEFRAFQDCDFDGFAGVESKTPMIGESGTDIVILDGASITLVDPEGTETVLEWRLR
jgi:hypothetical protein